MRRANPIATAVTLFLLVLSVSAGDAAGQAAETTLVVRVLSHDAKLLGSGVGGARVTVRHAETGEILAQGVHEGGTGDTRSIVMEPVRRGDTVLDTPGAAHFTATLELETPTPVEVVAEGPLGTPHATQRATKTLLLVPGEDVLGEGLVLELNGFAVEVLEVSPSPSDTGYLEVVARVTMLCGCPLTPGGLWDAERVQVTAHLVRDGETLARKILTYAGEESTFSGSLPDPVAPGAEVRVVASDPSRANFGMAVRAVEGS